MAYSTMATTTKYQFLENTRRTYLRSFTSMIPDLGFCATAIWIEGDRYPFTASGQRERASNIGIATARPVDRPPHHIGPIDRLIAPWISSIGPQWYTGHRNFYICASTSVLHTLCGYSYAF